MGEAVNTEHLMAFVDEARGEGNQAYKAGKLSEALNAWQRGLDAIGQVIDKDGQVKLPIAKRDVEVVLRARSTLHSNRGQALMSKEFWRRAIVDLSEAVKVDRLNAKALWRRYRCHRALRHWAEAEADLEALLDSELQEAAAPLLAEAKMTLEKVSKPNLPCHITTSMHIGNVPLTSCTAARAAGRDEGRATGAASQGGGRGGGDV